MDPRRLNPLLPCPGLDYHDGRTREAAEHGRRAQETHGEAASALWAQCAEAARRAARKPRQGTPLHEVRFAYQLAVQAASMSGDYGLAKELVTELLGRTDLHEAVNTIRAEKNRC